MFPGEGAARTEKLTVSGERARGSSPGLGLVLRGLICHVSAWYQGGSSLGRVKGQTNQGLTQGSLADAAQRLVTRTQGHTVEKQRGLFVCSWLGFGFPFLLGAEEASAWYD